MCLWVTTVSSAVVEPIELRFGGLTWVGQRNHGVQIPRRKVHFRDMYSTSIRSKSKDELLLPMWRAVCNASDWLQFYIEFFLMKLGRN